VSAACHWPLPGWAPFALDTYIPSNTDTSTDGYVVGMLYPAASPHPPNVPQERLVPPQTFDTIGDRLSAQSIDWAWYAEGWSEILGSPTYNDAGLDSNTLFQYNHQPFVYFANYGENGSGRSHHQR
jgi:phospholipase C